MHKKIKVLWLCNAAFSDTKSDSSGTWLHVMADALINTEAVNLYNITQARVKNVTRQDFKSISQWLLPWESLNSNGLPSTKVVQEIQKIVDDINPDIIHVWGTETYWGLLTARGCIKGNIILEIQGFKFAIEKYFYSGLSLLDIIKCFGLKEFLKPSVSLTGLKRDFKRWGKFEIEMLLKHEVISTQSNWVRAYVRSVNPMAEIVNTSIPLRSEFIEADKWELDGCVPFQVFTSASPSASYKGLHILLDAIAILKKRYPEVKLCIGGSVLTGLRQGGFLRWLKRKIKHLDLGEGISWLGPLDAAQMVYHMQKANAVVIPSFIESYCLALDEALAVGAPTIASFAGAMPELATHGRTALFFSPGDAVMCANAIETFFRNREYAAEISANAYNEKRRKNNSDIALTQLATYRTVIAED